MTLVASGDRFGDRVIVGRCPISHTHGGVSGVMERAPRQRRCSASARTLERPPPEGHSCGLRRKGSRPASPEEPSCGLRRRSSRGRPGRQSAGHDARTLTERSDPRPLRLLGVAKGTLQARVDKLTTRGVIENFGATVSPSRTGYPILALRRSHRAAPATRSWPSSGYPILTFVQLLHPDLRPAVDRQGRLTEAVAAVDRPAASPGACGSSRPGVIHHRGVAYRGASVQLMFTG